MRNPLRRLISPSQTDSHYPLPKRYWVLPVISALTLWIGCLSLGQSPAKGTSEDKPDKIAASDSATCMGCHEEAQEAAHTIKPVNKAAFDRSPHKNMTCQDCHTQFDATPHTPEMLKEKVSCGNCHSDVQDLYLMGAHSKRDLVHSDHPTCITCHGDGDPHAIKAASTMTKPVKAALCSGCHRETGRMDRYGVDSDAVPSYEESFHGKALLRFHASNTAVCTDCHQTHSVLPPSDPRAATNRKNANALCSQPACHNGAKASFAMSGANHLRLKIKDDFVLQAIDMFFRYLVVGVIAFLMLGIALDLRRKVFGKEEPQCGRFVGLLLCSAFLSASSSLGLAVYDESALARSALAAAGVLIVLAYLVYFIKRPPLRHDPEEPLYERMSLVQRMQHGLFAIFFTVLVSTGLPLKFSSVETLQHFYNGIGGLAVAREIHRTAAVGMIVVWFWHMGFLLLRWKRYGYKREALTMVPTVKDLKDFVAVSRVYLGLAHEEPHYGRYQFRQKLDYMAEYWGVPVMVLSGLILWFPIYWGNRLPEEALSVAIVAHGWEATLAFLAIVLWHLYNQHFNPDAFPTNFVWITGKMRRSQMERDHALELRQLEAQATIEHP